MKHAKLLKILAGFLSCMLIFTILSRAASEAGIVTVTTGFASPLSLDHSVFGTGKVVQVREEAVLSLPDQVVEQIYVDEGSLVEAGDLLFQVDAEVLEEQLTRKKQEIETLKLQMGDTRSRLDADAQKKALSENQAAEDYDLAARRGNLDVTIAAENLAKAKEKLEEYRNRSIVEIVDDGVRDQLLAVCKEKEAAYLEAVEELETLETQIQTEIELAYYESRNPVVPETPLETETELETVPEGAVLIPNETPVTKASYASIEKTIQDQYAKKRKKAKKKIEKAKTEKESADQALLDYDQQQLAGQQTASDDMEQQLVDQVASCQQAYDAALLSSAEGLNMAGHSLENAKAPEGRDSTLEISQLDLELLEREALKLEEFLLRNGEVRSPVQGIVTDLAITTGNKTVDGMAVLLADITAGMKFTAEIPKEQEKYVSRKDPVILKPLHGDKIEGFTVDSIASSEEEGALTVTINLADSSLEIGETAEFQVEKRSKVYPTCVPISALHEDQKGSFVYVLQEKETILGTELTAKKQSVTVQDKNSQYAALGDYEIPDTQKVIVGSDKLLSDGSRIREES